MENGIGVSLSRAVIDAMLSYGRLDEAMIAKAFNGGRHGKMSVNPPKVSYDEYIDLCGFGDDMREAYRGCEPVSNVEGGVVEGVYSGHRLRSKDGVAYVCRTGIRGAETGKFRIEDGTPVKIE